MKKFISNLVDAARRFTGLDFAIFKLYLIAVGILLGAYFSDFFLNYISVVWIIAFVTWFLMLFITFRYYKKRD